MRDFFLAWSCLPKAVRTSYMAYGHAVAFARSRCSAISGHPAQIERNTAMDWKVKSEEIPVCVNPSLREGPEG